MRRRPTRGDASFLNASGARDTFAKKSGRRRPDSSEERKSRDLHTGRTQRYVGNAGRDIETLIALNA